MSIARSVSDIDKLKSKAEDYRYELINTLDQLIAVQDQNTKLVREFTMAYKELLELRDHRDELLCRVDELREERDDLKEQLNKSLTAHQALKHRVAWMAQK